MPTPLHVLLVDERHDQLAMVAEFLLRRDCRVESCADPVEALAAIEHRRAAGDPYDILLLAQRHPDPALLQQFRRRDSRIALALCSPAVRTIPDLATQAARWGWRILFDIPIDLQRLEVFLTQTRNTAAATGTYRRRPSDNGGGSGEGPFFGTSRIAAEPLTGVTVRNPQPADLPAPPENASYQRQRSASFFTEAAVPQTSRTASPGTTGRIRRSVTGRIETDPRPSTSTYGRQPPTPAGHIDTDRIPSDQKKVACAFCRKPFVVQRKTEAYTVICIHCGQMNRIMPG